MDELNLELWRRHGWFVPEEFRLKDDQTHIDITSQYLLSFQIDKSITNKPEFFKTELVPLIIEKLQNEFVADENGEFEFLLPKSNKKVTFTLLTGKDEEIIDIRDKEDLKRNSDGVSNKLIFSLEQQVKSIDGEKDKIKISNTLKKIPIIDSRSLRKYIEDITPGLDFKTTARTQGGESVDTFLRFNTSFFWPEL